jgi:signal transduction histidine kinase/integral membrane sensor domain MASE1
MKTSRVSANILIAALLLVGYVDAGKLGLQLAFVNASATAVWPPTGIAIGALLLLGRRVWPIVFVGAFLVNVTTAGSIATSLGIAAGNTLEAVVGAALAMRFAGGPQAFVRAPDVLKFAMVAAMLSTTVAATTGVLSLSLGGFAPWSEFGRIWVTWWLGDATGCVLVAPMLILWATEPVGRWTPRRLLEAGLLLLSLAVVGEVAFGAISLAGVRNYEIGFLAVPPLVWAAFRFGQRETATATFLLAAMALWGTLHGLGPFAREDPNESLLLLQAFLGVNAVLGLVFSALVAEGRRAEEERLTLLREAQIARRGAEASEARAAFLADVSGILGSSLDYDATLVRIAHLSLPMLGDLCAIDLLREDGTLRRVAHAHVDPTKERLVYEVRTRHGFNPAASGGVPAVLRSRESVLNSEVTDADLVQAAQSEEQLAMFRELGLQSWIIVPLIARERLLGTITFVITESGRRFGRGDLALAEGVARRAAMAIDNARLYRDTEAMSEEAHRRRREAEIFAEVAASTASSLDLDRILERVVHGARELSGADIARIALRNAGSGRMLFRHWVGSRLGNRHPVEVNRGKGLGGYVWETGQPYRSEDHRHDPRARADLVPLIAEEGTIASLVVPIRLGGQVEGLLYLDHRSRRTFAKHDEDVVQRLADHAAVAIQNARALAAEKAARADAEAANRAKDEFIAMLGHELRNPLGAISNSVYVLDFIGARTPAAVRARQVISRGAEHLARMVDDLLDMARLARGKIALDRQLVNLAESVTQCLGVLRATGKTGQHEISVDVETVWVEADPVRIQQVFSNLILNAVKYTGTEGRIDVSVAAADAQAVVRVQDTGLGIAPEMLPRIFEPFQQGEHTIERSQGGLGIGLTLAKRLVEAHGGTIEAYSEGRGRGSRFTIRLPKAQEPALRPAIPSAARGPAATRRILIVEDNEDARDMLRLYLVESGHQVYEAVDGPRGIEAALRVRPEVALIDIGLPGLDGYEVVKRIRATPEGKRIFLVALTGYGQPEDHRRARQAGFDAHLVKPFDRGRLVTLLAQAGRKA